MHPLLKPKYLIIELKCLKDIKVEANQVALWHFREIVINNNLLSIDLPIM